MTKKTNTTPRGTVGAVASALRVGRLDGFINTATGQGVEGVDKTVGGYYVAHGQFDESLLTSLHATNDLSSLVVDIVPEEAMRLGFTVSTGDVSEDEDLIERLDDLDVSNAVMDADRWGRLYGGAAIMIGTTGGGAPHTPLNVDTVASVDWLKILDRTEMTPHQWDAMGNVVTYMVTPRHIAGAIPTVIVHASRLLMFGGVKTSELRKLDQNGWDDSVLNRVYAVIRQFDGVFNNAEVLLADGNQAVFKMSGLANAIAADTSGTQAIEARFRMMNTFRSVHRALVLDAGDGVDPAEEFERQAANFSGLADLVEKFILRLSSALRIPASILMGQSPAGLDATGEADFRGFYDRIAAHQKQDLGRHIKRLIHIIRSSSEWTRKTDRKATVNFPALWSPSDKEEAETRLINANADAVYISNGVLTPEEVTVSRFTAAGYSNEITISAEGRKAREESLEESLERLNEEEVQPDPVQPEGEDPEESNPITVNEEGVKPDPAPGR